MQRNLQKTARVLVAVGIMISLSNEPARPACSDSQDPISCPWTSSGIGHKLKNGNCVADACYWEWDPRGFDVGVCHDPDVPTDKCTF